MKKITSFIILLILYSAVTASNQDFYINGIIKDKVTKKIIPFVTVILKNNKDSICSTIISDSKGEFNISTKKGRFKIIFKYIGYKTLETDVNVSHANIFLGTVFMTPNVEELDAVTITANTYENKIDRDVYTITKNLKAGTASAAELLGKLREVDYDYFDNSIRVNNKTKVLLLIDGLKKSQKYIKNISPDRITRIEVIKDPGGKYTAEGYDAVINLILKKNYTGFEAFTSDRNVTNLSGANGNNPLIYSNIYSNLTYTYKRLNIYGSYANDLTNINLPKTENKALFNKEIKKLQPENNLQNIQQNYLSHSFILGADFHINDKHTISIENNYKLSPQNKNITNFQYIVNFIENGNISEKYLSEMIDSVSSDNYNVLTAYIGKFSEKSMINIDFAYNYYQYNKHKFYQKQANNATLQTTDIKKNYTKLNITYFYSVSDIASFELGYANTLKNSITGFESQNSATIYSFYRDIRNNLYSYFNFYPNKKFNAKLGAIIIFYNSASDSKPNNYFRCHPYINVKYKASDKITFLLKYHTNGKLPNSQELNPFESIVDSLTYQTGNPFLEPYYTHKISTEFNLFKNRLNIEPYYHFAPDYISKTGIISDDLLYIYNYSNTDMYERYGIKASSKFSFFNKSLYWSFSGNIFNSNVYYNELSNTISDWSIKTNLLYFNKKYMSVIALMLKKNNIKNANLYGYYSKGNDFFALFLRKILFKNKLNITILYGIPLNLGLNYTLTKKIINKEYTETTNTDISLLKNLFMFKISYRFSSGKILEKIKKKNMIEDESEKNNLSF